MGSCLSLRLNQWCGKWRGGGEGCFLYMSKVFLSRYERAPLRVWMYFQMFSSAGIGWCLKGVKLNKLLLYSARGEGRGATRVVRRIRWTSFIVANVETYGWERISQGLWRYSFSFMYFLHTGKLSEAKNKEITGRCNFSFIHRIYVQVSHLHSYDTDHYELFR